MAVLHPLECYLLESWSSPEHFAITRDAVIDLIDAHEAAHARLQNNLDPRQRSKSQWQQGDVVWGTRVLPNIRPARDRYIRAYIGRTHNDPSVFRQVGNALSNWNRGIVEFWDGWMTDEERRRIDIAQTLATKLDDRLGGTISGWEEGDLTYNGLNRLYQLAELPRCIPRYALEPAVRVEKGEIPKQVGIYLPDVEFAAAHLLYPREWAFKAYQGVLHSDWVDPDTGKRDYDWVESQWVETGWTLIRRVAGEFIEVPEEGFFPRGEPDELYNWPQREAHYVRRDGVFISAWSGEHSPHSGKWSTFSSRGLEYIDLQQGQTLPQWNQQPTRWTLIERTDGGSCLQK